MIDKFISGFKTSPDPFQNGYCYYFAHMLQRRFGGNILYEPVRGHFVLGLAGHLYDSTGDVTDTYDMSQMYQESMWSKQRSIVDGCILK